MSYFDIRYRNRIVTPIIYTRASLTEPVYAPYVTLYPTVDQQNDVISRLITFTNLTRDPYDPASAVAIVDNSSINARRQSVHGIDISGRYSFDLGKGRLTPRSTEAISTASSNWGRGRAGLDATG